MREPVTAQKIERLMEAFARAADARLDIYFVGGTTAVLQGWRDSTIDVDFVTRPENESLERALPLLKDQLSVNLEMASPIDFIPVPAGWEDRSPLIRQIGSVVFRHFDLYAQALAKIERGHERDIVDVSEMLGRGLVDKEGLAAYFARVEAQLYRFPAIDAPTFRRSVEQVVK